MSEPNQDYKYPMAQTFLYAPVTSGAHLNADRIPIFWGPAQFTTQYPSYSQPTTEAWRYYEHLNIPVVTRFLYDHDEDIAKDEYNDDDSPSPPAPPPFTCPGFQYEIEPAVQMRLRRSTAFNPDNPFDSGPYQAEFPTAATTHIKWFTTTLNVIMPYSDRLIPIRIYTGTKGIDDVTVYEGPIKDCPRLITIPGRRITWYRICTGGGTPEGGTRTLADSQYFSLKEGDDDVSRKPECEFTVEERLNESDFDSPPGYPYSIYPPGHVFSEVTYAAKDWYGCNDEDGPRDPPPDSLPFPLPPPPP